MYLWRIKILKKLHTIFKVEGPDKVTELQMREKKKIKSNHKICPFLTKKEKPLIKEQSWSQQAAEFIQKWWLFQGGRNLKVLSHIDFALFHITKFFKN